MQSETRIKVSRLYAMGTGYDFSDVRSSVKSPFDYEARQNKIKTRTRTFTNYLKEQFGTRYEFFPVNSSEEQDVVYVGDRLKHKNVEIAINYLTCQVRLNGVIVVENMAHMEKLLGKVERVTMPDWASAKKIKLPKMKKSNAKIRKVHPKNASHIQSFEFEF